MEGLPPTEGGHFNALTMRTHLFESESPRLPDSFIILIARRLKVGETMVALPVDESKGCGDRPAIPRASRQLARYQGCDDFRLGTSPLGRIMWDGGRYSRPLIVTFNNLIPTWVMLN